MNSEFQRLYTGRLWSVLGWDQLTTLWRRIDPAAGWYLHAFGASTAPALAADAATVKDFIARIDALLRAEHHESYCGIVYADDLEKALPVNPTEESRGHADAACMYG